VVTNTGAASHIKVQGSDAAPSTGSPIWKLCHFTSTPRCSEFAGPGVFRPGTDEYRMALTGGLVEVDLTKEPRTDELFGGGGAAAAGAQQREHLFIIGPAKSTNNSTSFTATVTWTAIL